MDSPHTPFSTDSTGFGGDSARDGDGRFASSNSGSPALSTSPPDPDPESPSHTMGSTYQHLLGRTSMNVRTQEDVGVVDTLCKAAKINDVEKFR